MPVFIVGMPRLGSTLVERTLASHPQVHAVGELSELGAAMESLLAPGGTAPGLGGEELRQIGARYLERVPAAAPAAARVTDKLPANFRYAGLIHLALPNAPIIHMRRDTIDTYLSCFSLQFGHRQPFTYDLGELGRQDIGCRHHTQCVAIAAESVAQQTRGRLPALPQGRTDAGPPRPGRPGPGGRTCRGQTAARRAGRADFRGQRAGTPCAAHAGGWREQETAP